MRLAGSGWGGWWWRGRSGWRAEFGRSRDASVELHRDRLCLQRPDTLRCAAPQGGASRSAGGRRYRAEIVTTAEYICYRRVLAAVRLPPAEVGRKRRTPTGVGLRHRLCLRRPSVTRAVVTKFAANPLLALRHRLCLRRPQ